MIALYTLLVFLLSASFAWSAGNESSNTLPINSSNQVVSSFNATLRTFLNSEDAARCAELGIGNLIYSGGSHGTAGGMTSDPFATTGYTSSCNRVVQPAAQINYSSAGCAANDTAWVILSASSSDNLDNFARVSGTDYFVDCTSSSEPTLPADSTWLMQVTISSSAISAVTPKLTRSFLSGIVNIWPVRYFATGGTGTSANPWTGWESSVNGFAANNSFYFQPGTFRVSTSIRVKSGWSLFCSGHGNTTLILAPGVAVGTKMFTSADKSQAVSGITISGCRLDGNRASNGSTAALTAIDFSNTSRSLISHNYITGFTQHGIDFSGNDGATGGRNLHNILTENVIDDYGTGAVGFGIDFVAGGFSNVISNNRITSTNANVGIGIDDLSGSMPADPSFFNTLVGNRIQGPGWGILIECSHSNTITGNTITATTVAGISLFDCAGVTVKSQNNVVVGNTIDVNNGDGIVVMGPGERVTGNHITLPGGSDDSGIEIGSNSAQNKHITVSDNTIRGGAGTDVGIKVLAAVHLSLTGNTIENVGGRGIDISSAVSTELIQQALVTGNTLKELGNHGIAVESGATYAISDVYIQGNQVINPSGVGLISDGIALIKGTAALSAITITDNTILDDRGGGSYRMRYGISATGTPTAVRVGKHRIQNAQTSPTLNLKPVPSACGTSPSVLGRDEAGVLTVGGGGAVTSCVLTFSSVFQRQPSCVVTGNNSSVTYQATATVSALTVLSSADMQSDDISYRCEEP